MNVLLAVSLILIVFTLYLFVIEFYSVAFKLTGLATKKIRFQVASMFTGAGFTTSESELIVNDDRRRKIAVACMYTGHIFSVLFMGLMINVLFSIGSIESSTIKAWHFVVLYVSLGLFFIVLFIKIPPINKRFQKLLETIAINSSRRSRNTNIITVVDYYGKHAISEVVLNKIPSFAHEVTLSQMELTKKYSINILSIKRGNRIVDVTKDTMFRKGDILIIYGLANDIQNAFVNSLDESNKTIVVDHTNEFNLLNNYGTNSLMEIQVDEVPTELAGVKMKDSHLTDKYGINIVIIKRKDEFMPAAAETIIENGDKLTVFGPYKNIKHLFNNDDK